MVDVDYLNQIAPELAALAGALIAASTAAIKQYTKRKNSERELVEIKRELYLQSQALSLEDFLGALSEIQEDLRSLYEKHGIDRFIMLRAWNGISNPRYTNAFYQVRFGEQDPVQYVHFEIDDDYIKRLHTVMGERRAAFSTSEIPHSKIREVYELEGILHSAWFYICKKIDAKTNAAAITYCSFAKKIDERFKSTQIVECELIVGKIKQMIQSNGFLEAA